MYFHPDITIKRKYTDAPKSAEQAISQNFAPAERKPFTVPFMKNNEFDYSKILSGWTKLHGRMGLDYFIPLVLSL